MLRVLNKGLMKIYDKFIMKNVKIGGNLPVPVSKWQKTQKAADSRASAVCRCKIPESARDYRAVAAASSGITASSL